MDVSPTFCVVPWTHLATNPSGAYRVCCNAMNGQNLVRDDQGRPYKVRETSAENVWHSPTYKKIRQQMLDGERPEMCQRCFREEDHGARSARTNWNEIPLPDDLSLEPKMQVRYVDLRLGNLCNLKCRMCNPYSSSQWVKDWNEMAGVAQLNPTSPLPPDELERIQSIDWPEDQKSWTHLEPILESVEEIYLTGGEPFLSIEHGRLLNKLISQGRAAAITLRYNTNLTCLPEKIINLWKHFKLVRVNVSFDAFGVLNDYIRYPSDWSQLESNMGRLLSMRNNGWNLEIEIHTTVQMYNILNLGEIYSYFKQQFSISPYTNILNHPQCLNIKSLSADLRDLARERLSPYETEESIRDVISYLEGDLWGGDLFKQFVRYTNRLDSLRGQSFIDLVEEFSESFQCVQRNQKVQEPRP
jgi:MoaA/NifB/PqqE/SkfB family radical SAM enzyme